MTALSGPSRAPRSGGAPDSLVVLLHGIGANGEDLIGLADALGHRLPGAAFHAPDAPEPYTDGGFGFQWYPRTPLDARGERVRSVEGAVNAYVDELLERYGLTSGRCVLAGFSQGCMVALHVGPRRGRQVAGVIGLSGALLTGRTLEREARSRPPFLLVHGGEDTVVDPVETAEAGRALSALGFEVEAHVLPGLGHGIDGRGLELAARFIERVLGGASPA